MISKILKELSQNETTLVSDSYFRVTLESYLLPIVSKNNPAEAFNKTHELIDQLESVRNQPEELKNKLESILKTLNP